MFKATNKDIEIARKVVTDTLTKIGKNFDEDILAELTEKLLQTSYSIGGGYDEVTLRKIAQAIL